MDPDFFSLGNFTIRWYGLCMASTVFISWWWSNKWIENNKKSGLNKKDFEDGLFWAVVWGIFGARLIYVLTNLSQYQNLTEAMQIWRGGLSFHGAIAFGIFYWSLWARKRNIKLCRILDLLAYPSAIGIIFGRIGNLMNGDDAAGRLTNLPIGYTWPEKAYGFSSFCPNAEETIATCSVELVRGPVHLSQVYGMLVGLILFLILWIGTRRPKHEGWLTGQWLIWYSLLRSVLEEPFRNNPIYWQVFENKEIGFSVFTLTQIASFLIIAIGLLVLKMTQKNDTSPWTGFNYFKIKE
ncbi:prolipoprotein diacylglyceryl transferase [bacterium]|nr:prolipoprotein diacylglyceryl transferase [bacterium]|tara:strand:+ start:828 stop:1712 length:885 start_codon:yes stop_codon:yes gene_type:complete